MSYLSRAQSFIERGEIMRAFYHLVNGLQRSPNDEGALDLLVELYIRDFDSPGVERDLLVVLGVVPQGIDIYEMIYASLEQAGDERRLKSLVQTRARENLLPVYAEPPHVPAENYAHAPSPQAHNAPTGPRQAQLFDTHEDAGSQWHSVPPTEPAPKKTRSHEILPFDLPQPAEHNAPDPRDAIHSAPTNILEAVTAAHPAAAMAEQVDIEEATRLPEDDEDYGQDSAMTGVFSSIDVYLDEEHRELREELANRSKKRLLWVGLAVLVFIVILVFVYPSKRTESAPPADTESAPATEHSSPTHTIDAPIEDRPNE